MPHILLPPERTKNKLEHMVPLTRAIRWEIDEARAMIDEVELPKDHPDRQLAFRLKVTSGWTKLKADLDARMLAVAKREAEGLGNDPEAVVIPRWTHS